VVYDGVEVSGKRLYHITNELIFPADDNLDIQLELYDAYDITKTRQ
jgi:hypothetical protein